MSSAVEHLPALSGGVVAALSAKEIRAHIQLIQQVTRAVMKEGVHFGTIPGTPKPTLYKPGAEVLCVTFRIAPSYRVEDLSDGDSIRYRVTCLGTHQTTGVVLGEGMGEASSNEEKYKWRNAVCDEEFNDAPEDRKRVKWQKGSSGAYQRIQIRTEPADIANTVLKMACKRAQIAMTINVTGCSDMFTQDLEDMPEEVREGMTGDGNQEQQPRRGKPATQAPRARSNGNGDGRCTKPQAVMLGRKLDEAGLRESDFLTQFEVNEIAELPFTKVDEALKWISRSAG